MSVLIKDNKLLIKYNKTSEKKNQKSYEKKDLIVNCCMTKVPKN